MASVGQPIDRRTRATREVLAVGPKFEPLKLEGTGKAHQKAFLSTQEQGCQLMQPPSLPIDVT
jgi:hypothetical protein